MDIKLMPEKYQKGSRSKSGLKSSVASFKQFGDQAASRGNLWLTISIAILLIAGSVCLGLWVYQRQLNQEKQELIVEVDELQAQRDLELEADFTELKKGIENLKKILKNRIYPSLVFKMLEELILPQVRFSDFDGNFNDAEVMVQTEASDYNMLAKQIVALEQDERIAKVELSGVILEASGRVSSNLTIEINPEFLRLRTEE